MNKKIYIFLALALVTLVFTQPDAHARRRLVQLGTIADDSSPGPGGIATELNGSMTVFVKGSRAYVLSSNDDALSIFNIRRPGMIVELGTIADDSQGGMATSIQNPLSVFVKGDYAFVASGTEDSVTIFDISNPKSIFERAVITNGGGVATELNNPQSLFVQGDFLYVVSFSDDSLSVFDIRNLDNIIEAGVITNADPSVSDFDGPRSVFVHRDRVYATCGNSDSLVVFEVNTSGQISFLGSIVNGGDATNLNDPRSVFVRGRFAYVASRVSDSLSVFRINNPAAIKQVGVIVDDENASPGIATQLDNATSVFVKGRVIYVASINDDSLSAFRFSPRRSTVREVATIAHQGQASRLNGSQSVFVRKKRIFVAASNSDSLSIFRLSRK